MFFTNHALTGVLLGLTIENEFVLAPVAVSSHFLLDMMPHFGYDETNLSSRVWVITGVIDGVIGITLVAGACFVWPERVGHILLGAFFAVLPDLLYIPEVLMRRDFTGWLGRFHARIQWGEYPRGWVVDAAWTLALLHWLGAYLGPRA